MKKITKDQKNQSKFKGKKGKAKNKNKKSRKIPKHFFIYLYSSLNKMAAELFHFVYTYPPCI